VAQQSALRVELVAPAAVRAGEPVPVTIRITNPSDKPVDAYFVGREIAFDIVVRKADSSVVWRRLTGQAVQTVLQVRTLAPGQTLELSDTWGQQVPPGDYTVEGVVLGQDRESLRTGGRAIKVLP
jgi:intracellular proteinase inhibitor BsuPI